MRAQAALAGDGIGRSWPPLVPDKLLCGPTALPYNELMVSFVETKLFTRLVQEYLTDAEYRELQLHRSTIPRPALSFLGPAESASSAGVPPAAEKAVDIESFTL